MKFAISFAILIAVNTAVSAQTDDRAQREANDAQITKYNQSGGWAYWHDSKLGASSTGTELMVRRCNRPEMRVATTPIFKMTGLSKLLLHGVDFTDSELVGIGDMKDLPELLVNGRITDIGLTNLSGLKSLKKLWIYQTDVNGTGLSNLKNLESLEYLYIDSRLTDEGLSQLKALTQLKKICVPNMPNDQLEMLKEAIPDADVID